MDLERLLLISADSHVEERRFEVMRDDGVAGEWIYPTRNIS